MSTFRQIADGRRAALRRPAVAVWLGCLTLLVPAADVIGAAMARGQPASRNHSGSRQVAGQGDFSEMVDRVSMHPVSMRGDGGLRGRVIGGPTPVELAGRRVSFLLGRRTMAATVTAADGRFGVRNLPGGLYRVVVDGGGTSSWRWVRVMESSSAGSPRGVDEIRVPFGGPVVRGQYPSPFPIMSLQQAATVGGIAVGAVAVPVIYHNTLMDNRVPATP